MLPLALRASDSLGLAREDAWAPGDPVEVPFVPRDALPVDTRAELDEDAIVRLFEARGEERERVFAAADLLRREMNGDEVSYVVTRNIQYTNVCYFRCGFCAFSKGKLAANLRGPAYLVPHEEIARRVVEAWERGATEVCLQGGIHPAFTGEYYESVVRTIKDAVPDMHVHAFSALEIWQGAATLGLPLDDVPRAAARRRSRARSREPPPRCSTTRCARSSARTRSRRRSGSRCTTPRTPSGSAPTTRSCSATSTGRGTGRGISSRCASSSSGAAASPSSSRSRSCPMEAPMFLQGRARRGPTFGEALLMHAVGRLALHPWITNVQASWVKLGPRGVTAALRAGVNDLGGTLMNESISRAAGSEHGQEMTPEQMEELIRANGRTPRQRTTLYADAPDERRAASFGAPPCVEPVNPPVRDAGLKAPPRLVRPGFVAARAR